MILIPKRRFTGTPTEYGGLLQQTISEFKELNIGTAQIKDASITTAKIVDANITTAKIGLLAVTTAKIDNLAVTSAQINDCSITKLTAGNLTVTGTMTTGKLVTGAAGSNRIEIDANYVAGYNSANALQFYLSAADGKAYAGAGKVVIDATGLTIGSAGASISSLFLKDSAGTARGEIYGSATYGLFAIEDTIGIWLTSAVKLTLDAPYINMSGSDYMILPATDIEPPHTEGILAYAPANHNIRYWNGTVWKTIATVS